MSLLFFQSCGMNKVIIISGCCWSYIVPFQSCLATIFFPSSGAAHHQNHQSSSPVSSARLILLLPPASHTSIVFQRFWKDAYFDAVKSLQTSCKEEGGGGVSLGEASLRWLATRSQLTDGDAIIIGASNLGESKKAFHNPRFP